MTRAAGLLIPILMLAAAAGGKDREAPGPPPTVKRLSIPNPIADPFALGAHLEKRAGGNVEKLEGVISVRDAADGLSYAWDPETCRLAVCWKGGDAFSTKSEIAYLAAGPGAVAASVGAFGPPRYFGYRLIEDSVPEFLYIQGRLGVEESYRIEDNGESLVQRFRIENGDFGVLISVSTAWQKKVKPSTGDWSGDFLKVSGEAAKKGFTLTYDLSEPTELPELPVGWGVPAGTAPATDSGETDEWFGVPAPPAKANPGYEIATLRIPFPNPEDGLSQFELLDGGRMVAVSASGLFCLGNPDDEESWRVFAGQLGDGASLLKADSLPDSLLAADSFGITRVFDTDHDGAADFYKAIRPDEPRQEPEPEPAKESKSESESESESDPEAEAEPETTPEPEPEIRGPEFFESDLRLTGPDPAQPWILEKGDGGSPAVFESMARIPRSWMETLSQPAFQPIDVAEAGPFSNQIFVGAGDPENRLRLLRIIPEFVGERWQGAVIPMAPGGDLPGTFTTPEGSAVPLRISPDGHAIYTSSREPGTLLRITRNADEAPFEISGIRLAADGFEFRFNGPLNREAAALPGSVKVRQGPAENLHEILVTGELLKPDRHVIDADARTLTLQYSAIKVGDAYVFDLGDIRSETGESLAQTRAIYTINAVPEKAKIPAPPVGEMPTSTAPEPDPFEEVDRAAEKAKPPGSEPVEEEDSVED